MNKFIAAAAALAVVSAPLAASAQSFGHGRDGGGWNHSGYGGQRASNDRGGYRGGYGGYRGGDRDGGNGGAVLAAGLFGLILGSAISSSHNYAYDQSYDYAPRCGWQTQTYQDAYGDVHYGQVQVCR